MTDGIVELENGMRLDFTNYDLRMDSDGVVRWWGRCTVEPAWPDI